jgi:uncharacterized membrane protein YfhO
MKKNKVIAALFLVYFVLILLCPWKVSDVNITLVSSDSANDGVKVQLFWDDGVGYSEENCISGIIEETKVTLNIPRKQLSNIINCRFDPTNQENSIIYSSIQIDGKEITPEEFVSWIVNTDQVQTVITEDDGKSAILFQVLGNDSKLYLNDSFSERIQEAGKLNFREKGFLLLIGMVIACIGFLYEKIIAALEFCIGEINTVLKHALSGQGKRQNILAVSVFIMLAGAVLSQFLLGDKYFVFSDATDSYRQSYPGLLYLARCISNGKALGTFNFTQGIGMGQVAIVPLLTNWTAWFGEQNVAYLLGVNQMVIIIGAGVFFYFFLRIKGLERWYSVILAVGYAFNGHMTIRASWELYSMDCLLIAIWLWSFELWFQKKDFRWIFVATVLFYFHRGSGYYFIFYSVFFVAYILFRYISEKKIKWWMNLLIVAGVIVAAGIYLAATKFSIISTVLTAISSSRAQNTISSKAWDLEAFLPDFSIWPTLFGRTIGMGILGVVGETYTGQYIGFLEDPTFYCGLVVLLLIPVAFLVMDRKKKVLYAFVYIIAFIYCFSEPVRIFINGFSGWSFKLSSFWIILFMIFTVAQIDWNAIRDRHMEKRCFAVCTATVVILLLAAYRLTFEIEVIKNRLWISVCLIVLEYFAISILILKNQLKYLGKTILVVLVSIEVVCIAYPIYNDRDTVEADLYWDETVEALDKLEELEGETFYRIDKQYVTGGQCDSLAQDYFGTAYYVGGTGFGESVTSFYRDLGLPGRTDDDRCFWGTSSHNEIETLLGVKYILTKENNVANYGYEKIDEVDGVSIYENQNSLPFGFVYNYAIERSTFEKLNYKQRQQVLLEACLVEDGSDGLPLLSEEMLNALDEKENLFEIYEIAYESTEEDPFYYNKDPEKDSFIIEPNTEDEMIAISITFNKNARGYICYSTLDGETHSMLIKQDAEECGQIYEIAEANVEKIWWVSPSWSNITSLRIAKIPKEEYYAAYEQDVKKLAESAVSITSFSDTHIEGELSTEQDGILYLPIPNVGWTVEIDGEQQWIQTINDTFIGVYISAGDHTIELNYPKLTFWTAYRNYIKKIAECVIIFALGSVWITYRKKRSNK